MAIASNSRLPFGMRVGEPFIGTGLRIKTQEGFELACGPDQMVLAKTRHRGVTATHWIAAGQIQAGDTLALQNNRFRRISSEGDLRRGWLVGHCLGNGGHNPDNSGGTYLRFWDAEDEQLITYADAAIRELGVGPTYKGGHRNKKAITTIRSVALSEYVDQYLERGTKRPLASIYREGQQFQIGFLQGLFDTDGSVFGTPEKGRALRLSQANRETLVFVQNLLLEFGIAARLYFREKARVKEMPDGKGGTKGYLCKPMWELHVGRDNIYWFYRQIGLNKSSKLDRLHQFISSGLREPYREFFITRVRSVETTRMKLVNCAAIYPMPAANRSRIFVSNGFVLQKANP